MDVLTPLQQTILGAIGRSSLSSDFILTGGTALAAFYLQHRRSEDLGFFTAETAAVPAAIETSEEIARATQMYLEVVRQGRTFVEAFLGHGGTKAVQCQI